MKARKRIALNFVRLLVALSAGIHVSAAYQDDSATALRRAIQQDDLQGVQQAIADGADVNQRDGLGSTPLILAATKSPQIVRALLRAGADPEATGNGRTILATLAFNGNVDGVRGLIQGGANVNAKDTGGWTPLLLASQTGHAAVVQALVDAGADVNAQTPNGWNALMQASYFDHLETARVLIPVSNVNFRNKEGITALMLAKWGCHAEVIDALSRAGATTGTAEWRRAPTFADFPVAKVYKGTPAPVDLRSNASARMFRTRLQEGARKGPNFAGHYTVVTWGCGSNCAANKIVDALTGRVYDGFGDERGEEFKPDSKLVIADPAEPGLNVSPTSSLPVRYYVWEGPRLRLIYEEACEVVGDRQKCGCSR
jgi:hypothetical protein